MARIAEDDGAPLTYASFGKLFAKAGGARAPLESPSTLPTPPNSLTDDKYKISGKFLLWFFDYLFWFEFHFDFEFIWFNFLWILFLNLNFNFLFTFIILIFRFLLDIHELLTSGADDGIERTQLVEGG